MAQRVVHFLLHVPKCAGTTLDRILFAVAKAFDRPIVRFNGTIYGQPFAGTDKKSEAWKTAGATGYPPNWLYASGHIPFGHFPPPEVRPNVVSIIRDPVPRMISMYRMGIARGAWSGTTPVKDLFEAGLLAANSMVRQLSGETSGAEVLGAAHVDEAKRNFERLNYSGRIQDFDNILGSILADYELPYIAYHSFQIGEPVDDAERDRLASALAPFVELDQALYDRVDVDRHIRRDVRQVSIKDISPSAPVLLVSPHLVSSNAESDGWAFVTAEQLGELFTEQP